MRFVSAFVSYPHEQLQRAQEVALFLRSLDIDVWFDKKSLEAGQTWDFERSAAQKRADLTVLIWSKETASRPGVIQTEIKDALKRQSEMPLGHISLILIRTDETPVPAPLNAMHYVNFSDDWAFKICRSIALKHDQMQINVPEKVKFYLAQHEGAGIVLRLLSNKTATVDFEASYFQYVQGGQYWDLVNSEINAEVIGGFRRSKFLASSYLNDIVPNVSWSLQMEEHYRVNEVVSLRFSEYSHFGGAHPNRGIHTKNFDASAGGKIELYDLFDHSSEVFDYISEAAQQSIAHRLFLMEGHASDYSLENYVGSEGVQNWELLSQWAFSDRRLTIFLSQFSSLPYVMGVFDAEIPWTCLKDKVSTDYRNTDIGRMILAAG